LRESGTAYDEGLYVYSLRARAQRPGITLLRAEKPDNWVLTDPDAVFLIDEAAPDHLFFSGSNVNVLSDITDGKKVARLYYNVDADALPGLYRIRVDQDFAFESGDPSGHYIGVDITDPGVIRVTPEPSALALLGAAALFGLRRRRGA
jgi:PEP-CTERM motif